MSNDQNLEPEAFNEQLKICAQSTSEDYETQIRATALCSIAISLKRIADIMEGKNIKQPIMMTADEAMKFQELMKK